MQFSSVLQILNVVILALSGAAGWRFVDEWRKSREERHLAEMAGLKQQIEAWKAALESQKSTHQHELEKRDVQITRLGDDNERLSQKRDERTALLEQEIKYLKAQAPADVLGNFEALKKWNEQQQSMNDNKLRECQSALAREELEHQTALKSQEALIEKLQSKNERFAALGDSSIDLQRLLAPLVPSEIEHLEVYRETVRRLVGQAGPGSQLRLIDLLGHWDCYVRNRAARELASRGAAVVPELVSQLSSTSFVELVLKLIGHFIGRHLQRYVTTITVLGAIGDPAIPELEPLLLGERNELRVRAIIALQLINTQKANEILGRHEDRVRREGMAPI
jgi:hypothetical protein